MEKETATPEFSLIVPVAADTAQSENRIPRVFTPGDDGTLLCIKAITGLNLDVFDNIYFTILRKHAERYDVDSLLRLQFGRLGLKKAKIIILDEPTSSQAETIARTIEKADIDGAIFIKDADGYFEADVYPENGVAVYPLERLDLVDPKNKSYVSVDDMQHITNIIEKRVVSHLFNAGGYCFENAAEFLDVFNQLKDHANLYLSHIIYYMLLERNLFRPIEISNYTDLNL